MENWDSSKVEDALLGSNILGDYLSGSNRHLVVKCMFNPIGNSVYRANYTLENPMLQAEKTGMLKLKLKLIILQVGSFPSRSTHLST